MADDKANLGISVRVPVRVLDEIEAKIKEYPRPRPSRGDLLEKAWDSYKSETKPGAVPSVLSKDNPDWRDAIPENLRDWLDVVERAVRVRNDTWRNMLASIRRQLELVAGIADAEPSPPAQSGARTGPSHRTAKPASDGGPSRVAAHPRTGTKG